MTSWKKFFVAIASLTLLLEAACASPKDKPPVEAMNSQFNLTAQRISSLERAALRGDNSAVARLRNYYGMYKGDSEKAMYWEQIAAENGGPEAEMEYGAFLRNDLSHRSSEKRVMDIERACFWYQRSLKDGGLPSSAYSPPPGQCDN